MIVGLWIAYAVSVLIFVAALILPVMSVITSKRFDSELASEKPSRPGNIYVAALIVALTTPFAASVLTPDWSPVTMFLFAAGPWALAAWSVVFLRRRIRGASVLSASVRGFLAAAGAPFLGIFLLVLTLMF